MRKLAGSSASPETRPRGVHSRLNKTRVGNKELGSAVQRAGSNVSCFKLFWVWFFVDAAHSHSEAIGFHANSLFVAHPIQDRTDSELVELADEAFSSAVELICSQAN